MVDKKYIADYHSGDIFSKECLENKCSIDSGEHFICKYEKSYCRYIKEHGKCKGLTCFHNHLCFSCVQKDCCLKAKYLTRELDNFAPFIIVKSVYCNIFGYHRLEAAEKSKETIKKWEDKGILGSRIYEYTQFLFSFIMDDNSINRSIDICPEYKEDTKQ